MWQFTLLLFMVLATKIVQAELCECGEYPGQQIMEKILVDAVDERMKDTATNDLYNQLFPENGTYVVCDRPVSRKHIQRLFTPTSLEYKISVEQSGKLGDIITFNVFLTNFSQPAWFEVFYNTRTSTILEVLSGWCQKHAAHDRPFPDVARRIPIEVVNNSGKKFGYKIIQDDPIYHMPSSCDILMPGNVSKLEFTECLFYKDVDTKNEISIVWGEIDDQSKESFCVEGFGDQDIQYKKVIVPFSPRVLTISID